ncbi:MAG: hypothetical protein JNL62_27520, partial [Bryobacterales bacterium]|nr:hypothetical protein [Bryobacterales bacterium]
FEELAGAPQYSSAADFDALQDVRPGDQVVNIEGLMAGRLDRAALTEIGYKGSATVELAGGEAEYLKDVSRRFDQILDGV